MKITCNRSLGDEEMKVLVCEAKLMDLMGINKAWTGDGMLYRTTGEGEFKFVDQRYVEDV